MRTADSVTRRLQNGSLTAYLTVIVLCMAVAVGWPWFSSAKPALSVPALDGPIVAVGLVLLILAATVVVLTAKRRLAAICGLGGVGAGVALIFLVFGAPDLALTQLMVETLTVIIVSLVLLRLPSLNREKKKAAAASYHDSRPLCCRGFPGYIDADRYRTVPSGSQPDCFL